MSKREKLKPGEPEINWQTQEEQQQNWDFVCRMYGMPMVFSNQQLKKWSLDYFKKNKKIYRGLMGAKDEYFRPIGWQCRMFCRENGARYEWLTEKQKDSFQEWVLKILDVSRKTRQEEEKKPKIIEPKLTTQQKVDIMFDKIVCEFERNIDHIGLSGVRTNPAVFISQRKIPSSILKMVADKYQPLLDELEKAKTLTKKHAPRWDKNDELINDSYMTQLFEAYEDFSKKDIEARYDYVSLIIAACRQGSKNIAVRKKAVPIGTILEKIHYLKEFPELKLTSIHPRKLIGNPSEVWIYNTKQKRIAKYVATKEGSITIKGTTLKNFDVEKSVEAVVSKPSVYFNNLKMTKRPLANAHKKIKNKMSTPSGRINKDCIILAVF